MRTATYITTSWDDGHPLDLRVADLLAKYGLRGTFYVPVTAECETMTSSQVRELSSAFEIGAHTLHHVDLNRASEHLARKEIFESKSWVEDCTGVPCAMFCPPKGHFSNRDLDLIRQAGYVGVRTVELLSIASPRSRSGLMVLPTTLQAYPHRLSAYVKNAIKRAAYRNLWQYCIHGHSAEWPMLVRSFLRRALGAGGVFHLWGHSWELQDARQWRRLEDVMRYLSDFTNQAPALTNLEVCQRFQSGDQTASRTAQCRSMACASQAMSAPGHRRGHGQ